MKVINSDKKLMDNQFCKIFGINKQLMHKTKLFGENIAKRSSG